MPTTTNVPQVKINIMDKATFAGITPSPTELYFITDAGDEIVDYQLPTAQNDYTWYRKHKSGWVEQGGLKLNVSGQITVTFPVEMGNNRYTILKTMSTNSTSQPASYAQFSFYNLTTTGATTTTAGADFSWVVYGIAA